jgi:hypothetical protein
MGLPKGKIAMSHKTRVRVMACLAIAALGFGLSLAAPSSVRQTHHVSGTIEIALPSGSAAGAGLDREHTLPPTGAPTRARLLEVSGGTTHAALFIDGSSSPAGQTTSCTASIGTGTGCTISWSANLSAPAAHTFAVETDNGSHVLDEGKASYFVNVGSNALGSGGAGNAPLSLNAAAYTFGYSVGSCAAGTCTGSLSFFDAAFYSIVYGGSTAVPTNGQNPTSGNVFDNDGGGASNLTVTSSNASLGTVTGTAQSSGSNTYATYSSGTLTIVGVNNSGNWSFSVACVAGVTGTFGINFGGLTTPSGDVTSAELGALSPAVAYPTSPAGTGTGNVFTCTSGAISGTSGTLVTN